MEQIFEEVGYIINQYSPESYRLSLYKITHIVSIVDVYIGDHDTFTQFKKYKNLKTLHLKYPIDYSSYHIPQKSKEHTLKKLEILKLLGELCLEGIEIGKNYSLNSNLAVMEYEYKYYTKIKEKEIFIYNIKHCIKFLKNRFLLDDSVIFRYNALIVFCFKIYLQNLDEYDIKVDGLNRLNDYLNTFNNISVIREIDLDLFNIYLNKIINLPKRIMLNEYYTDSFVSLIDNHHQINALILEGWNGSLPILKNTSLQKLIMNRYNGDMIALKDTPIEVMTNVIL